MPSRRVKWEKIDKEEYNRVVTGKIVEQRQDIASEGILDAQICKINQIVVQAAEAQGPKNVRRQRKKKLDIWTPEISQAVKAKKKSFYEWKNAERIFWYQNFCCDMSFNKSGHFNMCEVLGCLFER